MSMRIEKKFTVKAPADDVWAFLTDPKKVASCLPGAAITGELEPGTYGGTMNVKVGPVTAAYRGKMRFEKLDAAAREAEIVASGQETRGKGAADMRMSSRVVAIGPSETEVSVASDVNVVGVLAQFGRGMIQDVSDQMFEKFTSAMRRQLEPAAGAAEAAPAAASGATAGLPAPAPPAASAAAAAGGAAPAATSAAAAPSAAASPPTGAAAPEPIPSPRASAVAVPLGLAEPHEPAEPGAPAPAPQPAAAAIAAGSAPLATAGAPQAGAVAAPAIVAAAAGALPSAAAGPTEPAAAASAPPARPAAPPPPAPEREDVLDLGSIGATAARRAAGRTLRNPVFWIVVAAAAAVIWLLVR